MKRDLPFGEPEYDRPVEIPVRGAMSLALWMYCLHFHWTMVLMPNGQKATETEARTLVPLLVPTT